MFPVAVIDEFELIVAGTFREGGSWLFFKPLHSLILPNRLPVVMIDPVV
jgi:hypothetical protein